MNKKILLVDNSAAVLSAAGTLLRESGYQVTSTNCGADTICLLDGNSPPDLLILDINMPGMDGYEILNKLRTSHPPVIVITGLTPEAGAEFLKDVSRVLLKPFDAPTLMDAVTAALNPGADPTTTDAVQGGAPCAP